MRYLNILFILILLTLCVMPQQVDAASPLDKLFPFLKAPSGSDYTIDGETVYTDNDYVRIEATPHTLTSSGWVTVKFWVKQYSGDLDICYGFNGIDKVEALKTEIYEEVDGKEKWNKNEKVFSKQTKDYKGSKAWQSQNLKTVTKNTVYTTRVWIEVPFTGLNKGTGKYSIGLKPSGESIDKAWVLDPWYNSSWLYRKQLTVYGSSAAAQTSYQKLIRVYQDSVGADVAENIAQYTTTDYADIKVYGYTYEAQTFTAETTGTVKKVWLKLDKVLAPTASYACAIRATAAGAPTGANLCSGNVTSTYVSTTADWYEFDMGSGTALTSGTVYAIILYGSTGDINNCLQWRNNFLTGAYTGGKRYYSNDAGSTWTNTDTCDFMFQVLTSTVGTTPLRVDCEGHTQDDFDDLRFTASDGTTLLDYWIESYVSGSYADVWVELSSIVQMTGTSEHTHFYIYYGNSGAAAYSNGTNTFVRFDNFEWGANGDNLNTSGGGVTWGSTSATISTDHANDGTRSAKVAGGAGTTFASNSLTAASNTYLIGVYMWKEDAARGDPLIWGNASHMGRPDVDTNEVLYFYYGGAQVSTGITTTADAWNNYQVYNHKFTTSFNVQYAHGTIYTGGMDAAVWANGAVLLENILSGAGNDIYFDDYYVAKFAVSQPLWGTPGTEEPIPFYAITLASTGWNTNWAIVNGNFVTPPSGDGVTQHGFDYGLTSSYGFSWTESGNWTTPAVFSKTLTGLGPATVYHYRAKVYYGATWYYGEDRTVATKGSPQLYEYWNTGGDGDSFKINAANWTYQTFTTNITDISHSVTSFKLKLKRVGTPGTITASIRNTSNSTTGQTCWSYPTGEDLITATYDGDTVDLAYTWYEFVPATEVCLSANTTYAIVVRVLAGDSSNYIQWQTDFGGGYTGGNAGYCTDSGVTWTTNCPTDQLFEIWGNPCLEVLDAKVFESYIEDGDWLICVLYKNFFQPYYTQAKDVQSLFYLQLADGTTVKASTILPEWGYRPACIYLSADEAALLEWGEDYTVRIYCNFGAYPYSAYSLQSTDWLGSDLARLDSWVRTSAKLMEDYYETTYTEYVSGKGLVLNEAGGVIFANNIPELDTIRPDIFKIVSNTVDYETGDYTQDLQADLVWQTMWGPQITRAFTLTGNAYNLQGNQIGMLIGFLVYAMVALLCFRPGHALAAVVIPIPILIIVWGTGLWELAAMGIFLAVAALLLVWQLWWKAR